MPSQKFMKLFNIVYGNGKQEEVAMNKKTEDARVAWRSECDVSGEKSGQSKELEKTYRQLQGAQKIISTSVSKVFDSFGESALEEFGTWDVYNAWYESTGKHLNA
jgi:hypothetical protein